MAEAESRLAEVEASLARRRTSPTELPQQSDPTPRVYANLWIQPQFMHTTWNAAGSPNVAGGELPPGITANAVTLRSDGTTTNTTLFRLRRTRLRLVGEMNRYMRAFAEIDVFPVGTGNIFLRNVLATGIAHWKSNLRTEFSAGSFKVPLTHELLEPSRDRPFLERTLTSIAFFPGDRDVGAWAQTTWKPAQTKHTLVADLAVVNGRTFGEPSSGILPDYNRGKDVVLHANYDLGPLDVGVGGYFGLGSLTEPATGTFTDYYRGAVHLEGGVHHKLFPSLGQSRLLTAATYGVNMDRGVRYSFALPDRASVPGDSVGDKHQFGYYARIEQDVSRWVTLGARYELYTTNLALPSNLVHGLGGLVSVNFAKGLASRFEYIHGIDQSHAEGTPVPTRVSDTVFVWMQARYD